MRYHPLKFSAAHPARPLARAAWVAVLATSALACTAAPAAPAVRPGTAPPLVFAFAELSPWLNHEGAAYTGAYAEIMRELARRLGRRLDIQPCPLKRCLAMLEGGTADVGIGLKENPERAAYLHFLHASYRHGVADRVFWVRRGDADRIRRYEDLAGLRIGVVASGAYFARFDADSGIDKEIAQGNEANLRKLVLGRLDAVLIPEDQALVLLHRLDLQGKLEAAKFRVQDLAPRSIAVARSSAAVHLLPQMEAAMTAMRRDGTLAAIYDRHYYKHYGVSRQQIKVD